MYRLLLAINQPESASRFESVMNWAQEGFAAPKIVPTLSEAIAELHRGCYDAVSCTLAPQENDAFLAELHAYPAVPLFDVTDENGSQLEILKELKSVLNRLHADFSDDYYDQPTLISIIRDELTHSLLSGEIKSFSSLERGLKMLRADIDFSKPCMLFELDMPQGVVYLADRWHHGQDRLENSLRSNFFGRYVNHVYYAVAVLSNRHIRLAALPGKNSSSDPFTFAENTTAHVTNAIQDIKEYLDLDICVAESGLVKSIAEFVRPASI